MTEIVPTPSVPTRSVPTLSVPTLSVPTLSVIVPARNEEAAIGTSVDALLAQSGPDTEILVVDNGSTDATAAVAVAGGRSARVRVIDASDRAGRQHACNVGLVAARADRVVFVDADDEVGPGYLTAMVAALDHADLVGAAIDHGRLNAGWVADAASPVQTEGLSDGHGFLPYASGGTLGVRRSVALGLGGFAEDKAYAEDVDFCWRAQLAGHTLTFVPEAVLGYRYRPSLRSMYRQHRGFGEGAALLRRDFGALGMPGRPTSLVAAEWWGIVRHLLTVRSRADLARWVRRYGRAVGRLRGSARYRVWYP